MATAQAATTGFTGNHNDLPGLTVGDPHPQYAFLAGRAGGQALNGGTVAGETLDLRGRAGAGDTGIINVDSPINLRYNVQDNTTPVEQFAMTWDPAVTITGTFIGGALSVAPNMQVDTGVFIPAVFSHTGLYRINAAPAFSAGTFINELSVFQNLGNFNLPPSLIMNIGTVHARVTAGTSTVTTMTGISFAPQSRTTVAGAVLTRTGGMTAVRVAPTFNTVLGSTVNMGTIIGMDFAQPVVALFGSQAGIENMTAYLGMNFPNMTFGGASRVIEVVRSALVAATNTKFLNHTGSAISHIGGNMFFTADLIGTVYGAAVGGDVSIAYAGGTDSLFFNFISSFADQLHFDNPADGRIEILGGAAGAAVNEINFVIPKGAFGEGGGAGNQKYRFVATAETITIGGGYSQFLLTQSANDTINAALSQYFGWTINAPNPTIGTGSLTDGGALLIGGNINSGTNRYGVLILSNPSGGTINEAFRVLNGRSRFADLFHEGTNLGFFGTAPVAQPTVTGSRGGNAALADLLTDLAGLGLIIDSTVA